MRASSAPLPIRRAPPRRYLRLPPVLRWVLGGALLALLLYLLSPWLTLWRLDHRVVNGPTTALAALVDIDAVREQIRSRLNKEQPSRIGEVSEPFIDWVQQLVRQRRGDALEREVSLAWVRRLLLAHGREGDGFLHAVSEAAFDSPIGFDVRVGAPGAQPAPVHLHLQRGWLGWRVTAVHY